MKIATTDRDVSRSEQFPERNFAIAANAQAFDILSSRIYTDPILAIVRELSTNASDSHVDNGNPEQQFDVHLPNTFEPFFSIRDYGTGLSEEHVATIFTCYFASTRNESNDFTGAMGLGSKSPFAYTDQFQVTSWFEGRKFVYSLFKRENGEPTIALLHHEESDEATGVEVKIGVQEDDNYKFVRSAERVYKFFTVRPNIVGAEIEWTDAEPLYEGDHFKLFESQGEFPGRINVVMGQVCYAVAVNQVPAANGLGRRAAIVVEAAIGDCSVPASREELHYDERTIETVERLVEDALTEARMHFEDQVKAEETKMGRIIAMQQFSDIVSFGDESSRLDLTADDHWRTRTVTLKSDRLKINRDDTDSFYPKPDRKYVFIENDLEEITQKYKNRLRYFLQTEYPEVGDRYGSNTTIFLVSIDDAARNEFAATFGETETSLTELEEVPASHRPGGAAGISKSFVKKYTGRSRRIAESWESIHGEVDTENAIAVRRKGYRVIWKGRQQEPGYVRDIAAAMGYTTVYGLPESRFDKLAAKLGLKDLEAEAEQWITDYVANGHEHKFARIQHSHSAESKMLDAIRPLPYQACKDMVTLHEDGDLPRGVSLMISAFHIEVPEAPDFQKAFYACYPLLKEVSFYYNSEATANDAVDYINALELMKAQQEQQ